MAELFPTPLRLACARQIRAGRVTSYLWANESWIADDGGEQPVTRHVNELLRAGLAVKPTPAVRSDKVTVELTDAGREWLAATEQPLGPPLPVKCRSGHLLAECTCQVFPERAS